MKISNATRTWLFSAALLALAGCGAAPAQQQASEPVVAGRLVEDTGAKAEASARITTGALSAELSGSWTGGRETVLSVAYRNAGDVPVTIAIGQTRANSGGVAVALASVMDGAADPAAVSREPESATLFDAANGKDTQLRIAPGETRHLILAFAAVPGKPVNGDRFVLSLPMASAVVSVRLRCEGIVPPEEATPTAFPPYRNSAE